MMGTKAQGFGFIKVIVFGGLFLIFFGLGLAPFINTVLGAADTSGFGGFGGWVADNLALWFFGGFLLFVIIAIVYGLSE